MSVLAWYVVGVWLTAVLVMVWVFVTAPEMPETEDDDGRD